MKNEKQIMKNKTNIGKQKGKTKKQNQKMKNKKENWLKMDESSQNGFIQKFLRRFQTIYNLKQKTS